MESPPHSICGYTGYMEHVNGSPAGILAESERGRHHTKPNIQNKREIIWRVSLIDEIFLDSQLLPATPSTPGVLSTIHRQEREHKLHVDCENQQHCPYLQVLGLGYPFLCENIPAG